MAQQTYYSHYSPLLVFSGVTAAFATMGLQLCIGCQSVKLPSRKSSDLIYSSASCTSSVVNDILAKDIPSLADICGAQWSSLIHIPQGVRSLWGGLFTDTLREFVACPSQVSLAKGYISCAC